MRASLPVALGLVASMTVFAAAEEYGTPKEAEAMVGKAIAHIKAVGAEKAYKDFTDKAPGFVDRDLYVVAYDMKGKALAHGQNPSMVGKDFLEVSDPDGKPWIKERVELAKTQSKFWHDYKFRDPVTKKVLPKSAYCEKAEEAVVCVGVYKR